MQNTKILPVMGLSMVLVVLGLNYAMPRIYAPDTHKIPIADFPKQIGDWKAGPDKPIDPEVQQKISTAQIIARDYTNSHGQKLELTVQSAAKIQDFHDPLICFPAQGWALTGRESEVIDHQSFFSMTAVQREERLRVFYCWMGDMDVHKSDGPLSSVMYRTRNKLFSRFLDRAEGRSLFIRVIAEDNPQSQRAAREFTALALNPIRETLRRYRK